LSLAGFPACHIVISDSGDHRQALRCNPRKSIRPEHKGTASHRAPAGRPNVATSNPLAGRAPRLWLYAVGPRHSLPSLRRRDRVSRRSPHLLSGAVPAEPPFEARRRAYGIDPILYRSHLDLPPRATRVRRRRGAPPCTLATRTQCASLCRRAPQARDRPAGRARGSDTGGRRGGCS
jgi:hypothetical protein